MWRRFYHVTHAGNVGSIIEHGLEPDRARGKLKAVWLADSKRLHWAIAHVAAKHGSPMSALWVAVVHCDPRDLKRFRWPGIYLAEFTLEIFDIYEAISILDRGPIRLVGERNK